MTTYFSTVGNFFAEEKDEVFSLMGVLAEAVQFGPLSDSACQTAKKIADFASNAKDLFAWPDLAANSVDLVAKVQDFFTDYAAAKAAIVFRAVLNFGGSVCDVLASLHSQINVVNLGKSLFWIRGLSCVVGIVDDAWDMAAEILDEKRGAVLDMQKMVLIAKTVASLALAVLAIYSLWFEVVVFEALATILSAVVLLSKISLYHLKPRPAASV